ncbi:hypothetical protein AB0G15_05995 [Streptosporangium sp. NPDC023825]|uniref:hypothetical protein n=1 Tax=Streptosporangium sp. NPDC023825 TaxID=3154909 RepID=UPI00341E0F37
MTSPGFRPPVRNYVFGAVLVVGAFACLIVVIVKLFLAEDRPIAYYKDVQVIAQQLEGTEVECESLLPLPADQIGIASQRTRCDLADGSTAVISTFQLPGHVDEELAPYRARQADFSSLAGTNWVINFQETSLRLVPIFQERLGGQLYE